MVSLTITDGVQSCEAEDKICSLLHTAVLKGGGGVAERGSSVGVRVYLSSSEVIT